MRLFNVIRERTRQAIQVDMLPIHLEESKQPKYAPVPSPAMDLPPIEHAAKVGPSQVNYIRKSNDSIEDLVKKYDLRPEWIKTIKAGKAKSYRF